MYSILYVNHVNEYSGAERAMLDWARRLIEAGHKVSLACPTGGRLSAEADREGIRCTAFECGVVTRSAHPLNIVRVWRYLLVGTWQLVRLVRALKVDIIHANSFTAALFGVLAARLTQRPLVWHMHNIMKVRRINNAATVWLARQASIVICVSRAVQTRLVEMGVPTEKVEVIYNVVDVQQSNNVTCGALRAEFGLPSTALLIGMVGQIAAWKGQFVFLQAAARVSHRFPSSIYVIVGDILAPVEQNYKEELLRYVDAVGLNDRVIFTGFRADAFQLMPQFDVLVHASILPDPLPTVLLEALVRGSCIVASRSGGVPEIIDDHHTGLLVTPNSPAALADILIVLLANPERRKRLREEARRRGQPFDLGTSQRKLLDVYARLAKHWNVRK